MSTNLKILEDRNTGKLMINGKEVDGFIDTETCPTCQQKRIYHYEFDAYFCPKCNQWLESSCADPDCDFCKARPEKPLMV